MCCTLFPCSRRGQLYWRGCRSNAVAWGKLDPIPLCCRGLHLFSDIYHIVKSDVSLAEEAPLNQSLLNLSAGGERKGATLDSRERAREHLTSIAELSLCVPFSHWCFEEMHSTVTRAPNSHTHDVIEVLSLQAADDAVLGRESSHASSCKYYFGTNWHSCMKGEERNVQGKTGEEENEDKTSWFLC